MGSLRASVEPRKNWKVRDIKFNSIGRAMQNLKVFNDVAEWAVQNKIIYT